MKVINDLAFSFITKVGTSLIRALNKLPRDQYHLWTSGLSPASLTGGKWFSILFQYIYPLYLLPPAWSVYISGGGGVTPSGWWRGVPDPSWLRGVPSSNIRMGGGYTHPRSGWGVPDLRSGQGDIPEYPLFRSGPRSEWGGGLDGVPPYPGLDGVPLVRTGWVTPIQEWMGLLPPPPIGTGWGYPPPFPVRRQSSIASTCYVHPEGGSSDSDKCKQFRHVSTNSDKGFNMGVYEKFFFHYFEGCREICSTQEKSTIF